VYGKDLSLIKETMEVLSNVCLEDKMDHNAYISDDDDVSIEPDDHHSNKRQKMTDEERLSRW
jgi:hypothetical protein